jgi:hypothetical protein
MQLKRSMPAYNIFVCGAEFLPSDPEEEAGAIRIDQLRRFLWFELDAMVVAGQLAKIGYDPRHDLGRNIVKEYSQGWAFAPAADVPTIPIEEVKTTDVLATFKPDLIVVVNEGSYPDKMLDEEIQELVKSAQQAEFLIRDVRNLGM